MSASWEVRPCMDATGQRQVSLDICLPSAPDAPGVAVIARCYGTRTQAQQIAAAPDLLVALERLFAWALEAQGQIDPDWGGEYFEDSDFGVAAAAIARARDAR